MTRHKDFKALVRARMGRTGETYTAAKAAMLAEPRLDFARRAVRSSSEVERAATEQRRAEGGFARQAVRSSSEVERAATEQRRAEGGFARRAVRSSSEVERAATEQRRTSARMFHAGRLRSIPARRKLRAAVLLEVLTRFESGRTYPEAEVSELLGRIHDDFAYLRRELVSFGYLQRKDGRYWVCPEPPERSARQRAELPEWEAVWLPTFVAGPTTQDEVA